MTTTAANTASVIDQAHDKLQDLNDASRSRLRQVADATAGYAQRGADRLRDTGATIKGSAIDARDATVGYTREEPIKALLLAAAAGAAIAGSIMLIRRFTRR